MLDIVMSFKEKTSQVILLGQVENSPEFAVISKLYDQIAIALEE